MFMDKLRGMHESDPLAFEVYVRRVASMIEDQSREEGRTDPRENPAAPMRLISSRERSAGAAGSGTASAGRAQAGCSRQRPGRSPKWRQAQLLLGWPICQSWLPPVVVSALLPNDVAAVPAWTWHQMIAADDDLSVFRVTDRPIHDAFGLFRAEETDTMPTASAAQAGD